MKKLSVAIITFNEEKNIARALKSVDFADQIIVVDSLSSDRTVEICKQFSAKTTLREFPGHIDQKNFALSLTTHDWVLCIDADEVVTDKLKSEILTVLNSDDSHAGYKFPRCTFYLGRWIRHSGWYPDYNIRLLDKTRAKWGGVDPHDKIMLDGGCGVLKGDLLHYPYRDISHHMSTINSYTSIAADRLFKAKKRARITDITLRPLFSFIKKYFIKFGFLDGVAGFVIAVTTAFYTFNKYLKLSEMNKNAKNENNK